LNRLSKEDLEKAVESVLPQIDDLIQRNRIVLVKTLIERCHARDINIDGLIEAIASSFGSDPTTLILKMSCIDDISSLTAAVLPSTPKDDETKPIMAVPKPSPSQLHGSVLAQTMLAVPGSSQTLIQDSILTLPPAILLTISLFTPTSRMLQSALAPTTENKKFRRKLINKLITPSTASSSPILTLALSNIGSYILDSVLLSAASLLSLIEQIAIFLAQHEPALRDSYTGQIVRRNWSMDLFEHGRRGDWVKKVKSASATLTPRTPLEENATRQKQPTSSEKPKTHSKPSTTEGKTPIQMARERFAKEKADKERKKTSKGTGANRIAT